MEKNVPKLFSEVELFQLPILLISSILNQEQTLKSEYTKLLSSLSEPGRSDSFRSSIKNTLSDEREIEAKISNELNTVQTERFEHIEERVQSFLELIISKGSCPFLEQSETKSLHMKRLSKSMRVLRDKLKLPKDEELKVNTSTIGIFSVTSKQIFDEIFKQGNGIRARKWKNSIDVETNDHQIMISQITKKSNISKLVIAKAQSILEILETNLNIDNKVHKETLFLKSEGAKLIYEILIGKSFEIDAFEMNDPEVQKLRSEEAISDNSMARRKIDRSKEK